MKRLVIGVVALAALAAAVWWWRSGDAPTDAPKHEPSLADKLRAKPLRTRWAPPVCRPTGIVKLPDGTPARDATVVLHPAPLSRGAEPDTPDVQTDATGRYQLPATAAGAWILIAVMPRHLAGTRHVTINAATDCANLDLTLGAPAEPVTGTITDVSGGPVRGALVLARPTTAPTGPPVAVALAGADGRYELAVVAGDYAIAVRHPQYVGVDGQVSVHGPSTFDAVLTPGAELRGIVLTRDKREPVPGARVTIVGGRASGAMGGVTREVVAGDDGRFVATGLGSGRAWIVAVGPGHASRDPVEIALGIAETRTDLEVLVDPARRIRGIVTHGVKPAGEAIVAAYLGGDNTLSATTRTEILAITGANGELTAETDADGVFELWGLTPGIYELQANGPASIPSKPISADVTKADADGLVLDLGDGVTIKGRVEPPQVATVSLGGVAAETDRWAQASELKTAPDGTFELHGAEPGEVTVFAYTPEAAGEVTAQAPATDVVVKLVSKGATVTGHIVDAHGKPVAGVFVAGWNAITGADGKFTANAVIPGEYELAVSDAEDTLAVLAPKETTINVTAAGIANLEITVEARDRTLRGVVIGTDGKPAADAWVVAFDSGDPGLAPDAPDLSRFTFEWSGRNKIALTDADGHFAISGLKSGAYDVAAEGNKGQARGVTRRVTPDQRARVQLVALGGLAITAVDDGKPVAHYELEVQGPEPDQRTVMAPDGRVVLTGLPPGDYTLKATTDTGAGRAKVTLAQGATANAIVTVGAWATITGQVVDKATGKPLPNVSAFVDEAVFQDTDDGTPKWITGADGRFTLVHVPPGPGEVLVFTGGSDSKVTFDAAPGAHVDVGVIRVEAPPPMPPERVGGDAIGDDDTEGEE